MSFNPTPRWFRIFSPNQIPGDVLSWTETTWCSSINLDWSHNFWHIPWSLRSVINSGGDYEELGESSSHPKPMLTMSVLRAPEVDTNQEDSRPIKMKVNNMNTNMKVISPKGKRTLDSAAGPSGAAEDEKNWAMELY
jgi:hypothetical protein